MTIELHPDPAKEKIRRKLAADVSQFMSTGGKPQVLPYAAEKPQQRKRRNAELRSLWSSGFRDAPPNTGV